MLDRDALREEVRRSLQGSPPTLPPKLFYDHVGAQLFEEITRLPEYYLTRTETTILEASLPAIARRAGPGIHVVEFGSGSGEKTERLLRALEAPRSYVPVDVAEKQLEEVARRLDRAFPEVRIIPVAADYTRPLRLPVDEGRRLLFFPGSTIGNFEPEEAVAFLRRAGRSLGQGAALLAGVDLVKPQAVLEAAYDDAERVTASFNRNALEHLNRIAGTDFRPEAFAHRAHWNADASRVEMHLVAEEEQVVTIPPPARSGTPADPWRLELACGDHIVTEHSYKYTPETWRAMADRAGWSFREGWTDARSWFAVDYLEWRGTTDDND